MGMMDYDSLPGNTPILVGAGQVVETEATATAPMGLAAEAAKRALEHSGVSGLAAAVDTVSVTRLFTDSMGMPECPFGRSDNPPLSVAKAVGATPSHCIYGQVGGTEPQSRVIEFAGDIARGERSVVLMTGAEAIRSQRSAQRAGQNLDWSESFDPLPPGAPALEDRGWGKLFVSNQEVSNGLLVPMFYFALIDQAQATARGRSADEHRAAMAQLFAPLSEVAAANPYAQFPGACTAAELLEATPLNHLYSKRMIAQDSVNQGAALVMCSVAVARELEIPREHWVFLHGMADGEDVNLSEREDPARSLVAEAVLERTFSLAGKTIADMSLIDIYSCFPCAVTAVADYLGLPTDGSAALTLTGGLPFFGGPGNNYGMHALAEAVAQLRGDAGAFALVTSVGGMFSKHAAGIYSRQPTVLDWAGIDTRVSGDALPRRDIVEAPAGGSIHTYVVNYQRGEPVQAMILADTADGGRFIATTAPGDAATVAAMLAADPTGLSVEVEPQQHGALHFTLG